MEKNSGGTVGISNPEGDSKGVILKLRCESFGDSLCATPTLRKLYEAYGKKIIVCSYKPFVFKNNPYVEYHIHAHEFDEKLRDEYEVLETFQVDGDWDFIYGNGTKMKYGSVDIRKIHCANLGFDLKPSEMHCEYYPDPVDFEESDRSFINNESYIVIHISQTWPSRTWAQSNYEELIKNINRAGYKVALIGFDTPKENNDYSKDCYNLDHLELDGVSFLNRTSLDQDFEIIKKANICVTCDTGILHLSGCTDTEIIYIGGSIDPIWRAPYRHGGQTYKFSFVGGSCDVFCASNVKHCISEHGRFNSLPQISECLENRPTYECHPTHEKVFKKIAEVNERNYRKYKEEQKNIKRVLIDMDTGALGDAIAWIPYVEKYRLKNDYEVFCATPYNYLFKEVYPEINFIEPGGIVKNITIPTVRLGFPEIPEKIRRGSVQGIASFLLDFESHTEEKPKIHIENKKRQIKEKYVCIATQSTAQAKYWNKKGGWDKVVDYLNNLGYKVICIDRHNEFGRQGSMNFVPKKAIDKTGNFSLQNRITDIYNCEFFIGLSSGLSWLAWALGKKVILISGFTEVFNEFSTPYRVINKEVCHGCWNKEDFDKGNWNWCPYHEGTSRQFECTKTITHQEVKKEIDKIVSEETDHKRVLIDFRSSALGDTVAWIPYIEEYRTKNDYKVFCSTFHNSLFKEVYPEINFIEPGSVVNDIQDTIHIGWMKNEGDQFVPPIDVRKQELQRTASLLLGLDEHVEIKPKIHVKNKERKIKDRYVCIATQSTAQAKYWNNEDGWQKTVDYLNSLGYKVVCIDRSSRFGIEGQYNYMPKGVIDETGDLPLEERVNQLYNCEFFIGLPSGLSWLAWALNKEVILISGFSNEKTEFYTPYRIINKNVCNSCWNREEFDASNWNWCPDHEGTDRQHECTKSISFEDVKPKIDSVTNFVNLKNNNLVDFTGLTQNVLKLDDETLNQESLTLQWSEIFMKDYYGRVSQIKEGYTVLDIGANVGFVTAYAMWKGASKCYSIEPMPKNFNILKKWVNSSEHRDKIKLFNKAISDRPVALPNKPEIINEWTPSVTNLNIGEKTLTGESIKIESLKLSDFFNQYPDEKFDFVKLDCEGGEWCLLNDEKELDLFFKKVKNVVMEVHLRDAFFKDFDYSFDFVEKFKMNGFEAQIRDASGEIDITSRIVNNKNLPDQGNIKAQDWYQQVLFYAKKI